MHKEMCLLKSLVLYLLKICSQAEEIRAGTPSGKKPRATTGFPKSSLPWPLEGACRNKRDQMLTVLTIYGSDQEVPNNSPLTREKYIFSDCKKCSGIYFYLYWHSSVSTCSCFEKVWHRCIPKYCSQNSANLL